MTVRPVALARCFFRCFALRHVGAARFSTGNSGSRLASTMHVCAIVIPRRVQKKGAEMRKVDRSTAARLLAIEALQMKSLLARGWLPRFAGVSASAEEKRGYDMATIFAQASALEFAARFGIDRATAGRLGHFCGFAAYLKHWPRVVAALETILIGRADLPDGRQAFFAATAAEFADDQTLSTAASVVAISATAVVAKLRDRASELGIDAGGFFGSTAFAHDRIATEATAPAAAFYIAASPDSAR